MKKELFFNLILTFLLSIVGFIQNKYFISYLGIEMLGILKLFNQIFEYLNIIEMGSGAALSYALYKPFAEKNIKEISKIISTIKKTYNKIGIYLFFLGILCTPLLSFFIKIENPNIYIYWVLFLINTASTYLYIKYIVLFTANQEFIKVKFIQSISKIFYQIVQIIILIKYNSMYLYMGLLLLDNLTQYIFFKRHYKINYSYIYFTNEKYEGLKVDIRNLFWHKIGGLIIFNTDLILISKLVSIESVGIYASYIMIFQVLKTMINIIYNVLNPKIGKYIAQYDKKKIYVSFKNLNILFIFLGMVLIFPTSLLINDFIKLWIGKNYILSKKTLILLCINYYIDLVRWLINSYKSGSGFFDDIQSPILESTINLLFSIFLGLKYGLNGILMGTLISNIIIILVYQPILVFKRCFDKNIKEYIKIYGNYFLLILLSLIILNIIIKFFRKKVINNWLEWLMYAGTVSIVTVIVLFLIFLLNKDFRNVIKIYLLKYKSL